jgi:hypothetical protein
MQGEGGGSGQLRLVADQFIFSFFRKEFMSRSASSVLGLYRSLGTLSSAIQPSPACGCACLAPAAASTSVVSCIPLFASPAVQRPRPFVAPRALSTSADMASQRSCHACMCTLKRARKGWVGFPESRIQNATRRRRRCPLVPGLPCTPSAAG